MTSRLLLLSAAFLAACDDPLLAEAVMGLPVDQAPAVLGSGPSGESSPPWQPIASLAQYGDYDDGTRAIYGMAVARLDHRKPCSGFLIDHNTLVTARDCVKGAWDGPGDTNVSVYFGVAASTADRELIAEVTSQRRQNMGVLADSAPDVRADSKVRRGMERGVCTWVMDEPGRDISYLSCRPATTNAYDLGEVWGFLELGVGDRRNMAPGYGMSAEVECGSTIQDILVGEGLFGSSASCEPGRGSGCFVHIMDALPGSKGGPLLTTENKVVGVAHGTHSLELLHNASGITIGLNPDGEYTTMQCPEQVAPGFTLRGLNTGTDLGTHAGNRVYRDIYGPPQMSYTGSTVSVGTSLSAEWSLICPHYTRGVGLVGSEAANGMVGNLGLICAPVLTPWAYGSATVVTAGSHDVGYRRAAAGTLLNTYLAEVRSNTADAMGMQTFAMCPPRSHFVGIRARGGWYVDKITHLECAMEDGTMWLEPVGGPNRGGIGRSAGGTTRFLRCPTSDGEITELIVNAQAWTDSFYAACSGFDWDDF